MKGIVFIEGVFGVVTGERLEGFNRIPLPHGEESFCGREQFLQSDLWERVGQCKFQEIEEGAFNPAA